MGDGHYIQITFSILNKEESLHFLDEKSPNLTQTNLFEKYVYMNADRLKRLPYARFFKLIRRK